MPALELALDRITNLVGKTDQEVAREVHDTEQRVLARFAARGFAPTDAWAHHVADAIKQLIQERESTLIDTASKTLRVIPPGDIDEKAAAQVTDFVMSDLARYYRHGAAKILHVAKLPGYMDGLPPSLAEHEAKMRARVATKIDLTLAEIRQTPSKSIATDGASGSVAGMPYLATVFRVMIASPSDVQEERRIAQEVIADWNAVHSEDEQIVLLPLVWERDSRPTQGDRPQGLINAQVLKKADVLVAIFWTRIGSPTGVAPSGTVEELREHIAAGKPALLYFSSAPTPPSKLDTEQLDALRAFQKESRDKGLQETFSTPEEFRQKLTRHLAQLVIDDPRFAMARAAPSNGQTPATTSAPLSRNAQMLLKQAALDDKPIRRSRTMRGGEIRAGNKTFASEAGHRAMAEWEHAIKELSVAGLTEDPTGANEVFKLTHRGYEAADKITKDW